MMDAGKLMFRKPVRKVKVPIKQNSTMLGEETWQ